MATEKRIKDAIDNRPKLIIRGIEIAVNNLVLNTVFDNGAYKYEWQVYLVEFEKHDLIQLSTICVLTLGKISYSVELVGFQLLNKRYLMLAVRPLEYPQDTVEYVHED